MTIYFFTKPNDYNMIFQVGIKADDGQRHICALWEQAGQHYVRTADINKGERKRYDFTASQESELKDFMQSAEVNREYFTNPLS